MEHSLLKSPYNSEIRVPRTCGYQILSYQNKIVLYGYVNLITNDCQHSPRVRNYKQQCEKHDDVGILMWVGDGGGGVIVVAVAVSNLSKLICNKQQRQERQQSIYKCHSKCGLQARALTKLNLQLFEMSAKITIYARDTCDFPFTIMLLLQPRKIFPKFFTAKEVSFLKHNLPHLKKILRNET
uniref:Uncharacterized protein n=1 Tax=Glossina austeni TaxID=7395 RepID=A0A1A9VQ42_GLOAU